ncbi:hypothetical protein PENARI_c039G07396 [Penicillium arizonense]|uniref:ABC transporter domain-containing protein n=1 Tax=Penicillium arizonense TaxID=1835702 RepID=A0A1F5L3Z1_PENAI|nr:hypothetical protein PENARI_c039G07396 [Penicillium arizonense]OGE47631.1 hypothetical protein PENARI_c039G07396 [Penicillium arizonense]
MSQGPHSYPFFRDTTIMFGLDIGLHEHKDILEKANCFSGLRAHLEQDNMKLKTFSASDFSRSTKRKLFNKNINRAARQCPGSQILIAFLDKENAEGARFDLFMLACFSLSEHHFQQIEKHGLSELFPHLLRRVIGRTDLTSALIDKMVTIIKETCGDDEMGKCILDAVHHASPNKLVYATRSVPSDVSRLYNDQTHVQRKRGFEEVIDQQENEGSSKRRRDATSALDSQTEEHVQKSPAALSNGRTTLVIAHRLSTIMSADRFLFLENGLVAESGTHEELVDMEGRYAGMWRKQNGEEKSQAQDRVDCIQTDQL